MKSESIRSFCVVFAVVPVCARVRRAIPSGQVGWRRLTIERLPGGWPAGDGRGRVCRVKRSPGRADGSRETVPVDLSSVLSRLETACCCVLRLLAAAGVDADCECVCMRVLLCAVCVCVCGKEAGAGAPRLKTAQRRRQRPPACRLANPSSPSLSPSDLDYKHRAHKNSRVGWGGSRGKLTALKALKERGRVARVRARAQHKNTTRKKKRGPTPTGGGEREKEVVRVCVCARGERGRAQQGTKRDQDKPTTGGWG